MSSPLDEKEPKGKLMEEILRKEYARSRREGAYISPCGTEGCQWEGFSEPPDSQPEDADSQ